LGDVRNRLFDV